jgi:hypothetical protein
MKTSGRSTVILLATLGALVVASGCSYTPVRTHPDFASAARKVQKVAVLSPDVEYTLLVLTGDDERLPEEERKVRQSLVSALPTLLEKRGYVARELTPERVEAIVKDANFTIEQAKTAYREASKRLYERDLVTEDEAGKFRVSIGPIGNAVAEAVDAEAFLFVRYAGFKKSEGLIAKEVVANAMLGVLTGVIVVPVATGASMEMALVDATTGDVLWSNRGLGNAALLMDKLPQYGVVTAGKSETAGAAADSHGTVAATTR